MSKLQISDLLNTFSSSQPVQSVDGSKNMTKASRATQQFLVQGNMKVKKIRKSQEIQMKRQFNYKATQQDMDKWLGIVKLNRQKQTLDLTRKQKDGVKINFFPSKPVSELQAKTDKILSQLSMKNQTQVMKTEEIELNKLDPKEAKRRLIQARKHRTMIFYEEIKRRRISKIKSKVYHKIKKKQKLRQQQKNVQTMTPGQKSQYMQKLTKNRIMQRISLRHNTKTKHIQNLLRFNKYNKDSIQDAINEVNQIRQKQLQKNKIDDQILENLSQQYDDENYRQQAIMDLEKELEEMEHQQENEGVDQPKGLQAMKFMKVAKEKQAHKDMQDAYKLINKLQNQDSQQMAIASDQDEDNNQNNNKNRKKDTKNDSNQNQSSRKTYGDNIIQPHTSNNQTNGPKKQFIKKNIHQALLLGDKVDQLTKGIQLKNLKDKYQPQRVDLQLNQQLLEMNREMFNNYDGRNQATLENLRQFQDNKRQDYEQQMQPDNKKVKGWGSWAGPNLKQKKVDPRVEIRKKLAKIEQIKRKRKDGQLSNVIINEVRNKQLKDYMVRKLPHEFTTAEQFEYLNQSQVGPEWNSMTQFKANIKPKVITRVGEVIQPIKMPKRITKA